MRKRKLLDNLSPLLNKPFFSSSEAKKLGIDRFMLSHYVKTGLLERVSRGLYKASGYQNPDAFLWGDLIKTVYSIKNGVICLISALAIYDLTDEIPREHWIAVPHGRSVSKPDVRVIHLRNMDLGITEIELENSLVPIFDRERTIVDSFRFLSIETAIQALKEAIKPKKENQIDFLKLQEYSQELRVNIEPYVRSFIA